MNEDKDKIDNDKNIEEANEEKGEEETNTKADRGIFSSFLTREEEYKEEEGSMQHSHKGVWMGY